MKRKKLPKIGEYVFISRWADKCLKDPWAIGFLEYMIIDAIGIKYRLKDSAIFYNHCWIITKEEGEKILKGKESK